MHKAPAVIYPVRRSVLHVCLLGLSSLTGVLAGWYWCIGSSCEPWRQWLYAITLLLAGLVAFRNWWFSPNGTLRWDGQGWQLDVLNSRLGGIVSLHLDLQAWLLLCLRSEDGSRKWLWLERRADPVNWHALRGAVFSVRGGGVTDLEHRQ